MYGCCAGLAMVGIEGFLSFVLRSPHLLCLFYSHEDGKSTIMKGNRTHTFENRSA